MKKSMLSMVMLFILFAISGAGYAATNYYVWRDNPAPQTPFTNWAWAATSIQDAVNLTLANDIVYVTNGTYDTGGAVTPGYALTNRVMITANITVTSMNGSAYTIIKGAAASGGGCGADAVRCVYLTNTLNLTTKLFGFTLSNGYTMSSGDTMQDQSGGGLIFPAGDTSGHITVRDCVLKYNTAAKDGGGAYVACYAKNGILTNCTLTYNTAANNGGGAYTYYGQLNNCTLIGNTVTSTSGDGGGGAYLAANGRMSCCTLIGNGTANQGGGVWLNWGNINNCTIISNMANYGGGAWVQSANSYMRNSLVTGNTATNAGGGVLVYAGAYMYNCTVVSNVNEGVRLTTTTATNQVYNCVVWGNTVSNFYTGADALGKSIVRYSCSAPAFSDPTCGGAGNIGTDPWFVDSSGNYRLMANSPCLNTGTNYNTGSYDLDGRTRIRYGTVDMGCYETIYDGSIYSVY